MVEIIVRHNDDGVDKGEETVSVDVTEVGQRRRWSWGKVDSGGGEWIVAMEMVEMGRGDGPWSWRVDRGSGDDGYDSLTEEMGAMEPCRWR